jgi:DNA processing protein
MEKRSPTERQLAWLTLKLIPGLGNRSILKFVRHFGSPEAVLAAAGRALAQVPGIREPAVTALRTRRPEPPPEAEWEAMAEHGIGLLCLTDADYPANLATIADPPAVLFVRGRIEPRDLVSVAVVGSRSASAAGMVFTERICTDLAQSGVSVVSGLAVGIDSAAHRGTLRGRGRTIAVLGCGHDSDYPRSNLQLREQIVESGGAVVTEFPLGTPPMPGHFPLRNRIISGLSLGVVVVEAGHQSGSLITARLAAEQGREVFAVPGPARGHRSRGPNRLLRDGAKMVENAEDVLEELRPLLKSGGTGGGGRMTVPAGEKDGETDAVRLKGAEAADLTEPASLPEPAGAADLTDEEAALMNMLDFEPRHIDEICRRVGQSPAQVMVTLMALELKGVVQQLPGKYFLRFGSRRAQPMRTN